MRILSEALAVGWPFAAVLAAVLVDRGVRERHRRDRVGAALHELRRPLQALALERLPERAWGRLEVALWALHDVERSLRGEPPELRLAPLALRPLAQAAVERFRSRPSPSGALGPAVQLRWAAGDVRALGDARRLGEALDNLIANALEHGRPPARVEATICAAGVRLSVRNRMREPGDVSGAAPGRRLAGPRGHGLRVVTATAVAHGGSFAFERAAGWAVATLELPLAPQPLAATRPAPTLLPQDRARVPAA